MEAFLSFQVSAYVEQIFCSEIMKNSENKVEPFVTKIETTTTLSSRPRNAARRSIKTKY